jgi:hypothetical protein
MSLRRRTKSAVTPRQNLALSNVSLTRGNQSPQKKDAEADDKPPKSSESYGGGDFEKNWPEDDNLGI